MEELKKLLQKNLEYTKEVHEMVIKIRKYIVFQQIMNIVKIVIIVVPLIIAGLYAWPFFREAFGTYQEILGGFDSVTNGAGKDANLLNVIGQIQNGNISETDLQQFLR